MNGGEAGRSAARQAENKKQRAEELRRRAARLDGEVLAWERGVAGEVATASVLGVLEAKGWVALHDRAVPGSPANIDHVVVGPPGVVVLDSKNYAGRVEVVNGIARRNGHRMDDDLAALERYAAVVEGLLSDGAGAAGAGYVPVHRALVIHRAAVVPGRAAGATVVSAAHLTRWLESLPVGDPPVDAGAVASGIAAALVAKTGAEKAARHPRGGQAGPARSPQGWRPPAPSRRRPRRSPKRANVAVLQALVGVAAALVALHLLIRPGVASRVGSVVGRTLPPSIVPGSGATPPTTAAPPDPSVTFATVPGSSPVAARYTCDPTRHSTNLVVDSPAGVLRYVDVQAPAGSTVATTGTVTLYGALPAERIALQFLPPGATSWSPPTVMTAPASTC